MNPITWSMIAQALNQGPTHQGLLTSLFRKPTSDAAADANAYANLPSSQQAGSSFAPLDLSALAQMGKAQPTQTQMSPGMAPATSIQGTQPLTAAGNNSASGLALLSKILGNVGLGSGGVM